MTRTRKTHINLPLTPTGYPARHGPERNGHARFTAPDNLEVERRFLSERAGGMPPPLPADCAKMARLLARRGINIPSDPNDWGPGMLGHADGVVMRDRADICFAIGLEVHFPVMLLLFERALDFDTPWIRSWVHYHMAHVAHAAGQFDEMLTQFAAASGLLQEAQWRDRCEHAEPDGTIQRHWN